MNTYLLTNNNSFRKFLEGLDNRCIKSLGWQYVTEENMFSSLISMEACLAHYLADEYSDFVLPLVNEKSVIDTAVAQFLFFMNEEDLQDLYFYVAKIEIILEDLMLLSHGDRIELIACQFNWTAADVHRIDLIMAN